ncbi:glycosyltransferase family 39 protein [Rhodovulum marinum]|uniref:Dolichyl-phosphate-mannose-protein mannosyltransferase n=1 Tax=Rhodovulum marinum TaxID=320662 RepID=A0A4R2PX84_9RHOB|nr:glycosyltransferase family 39 protein [Rhodovulum marinum]TCP39904.1 dolichyl-phosphate-mannose-protein mannosyltransferase [Rhodovulum marinum]
MTGNDMPARGDRRVALIFLLAITAYFAAQAVLRLGLGGALETDEAEMMVMTPGLRWGYGPQLPLYNWLQLGAFEVFGRSLLALSLLKNGLLWLSYLCVFLGLRLWLPAGVAALGALSLFLVPDIAWEAQRATTHSNMLFATSAATLAAFLWAVRGGAWAAWIALGLAVGLGGLAKYNFWLVPVALLLAGLTIAPMRRRLLSARALVAPLLALAIVAGPYAWMIGNRDLAFASVGKLDLGTAAGPAAGASAEGLARSAEAGLALVALPLLVWALLWLVGRARGPRDLPAPGGAALLLRGALLLVLAVAAGVWLSGMGQMTQRWLLPIAFLLVPGLFVWLAPRLGARAGRGIVIGVALLAVLVMAGLTYDRYKPGARRDVDFATLPAALQAVAPMPDTPVVAEFYTAGNIARLRPDWRIAPYLPFAARAFGGGPVLFVLREEVPPNLGAGIAQAGWGNAAPLAVLAEGALELPHGHSDARLALRYVLAEMPAVE